MCRQKEKGGSDKDMSVGSRSVAADSESRRGEGQPAAKAKWAWSGWGVGPQGSSRHGGEVPVAISASYKLPTAFREGPGLEGGR